MAIQWVRVDDRLIHGQVMTTWVKQKKIEQVLIINDAIAKDEVQQAVFQMVAPAELKVRTFGVQQFVEIYKKTEIKRRTLLLFTVPEDVLAMARGGVKIEHLNLGGIKFKTGRKRYSSAVSLSQSEIEDLYEIKKMGISVSVQMVPTTKETELEKLVER